MVWGDIACNTRSPLVLISGTMAAQWYINDHPATTCVATHATAPKNIFFYKTMPDLTRLGCFKTVSVLLLPFLCLSDPQIYLQSSISGIIWDGGHPTSLNELEARLQQIWSEMSRNIIQNLYTSLLDRIASCIRARGR
ncbi:transposable element Tcb1 transposase [Trichonephila clavipes]|nr:transposable element Tcb1 transposase [Trichonephila clavipes]